MHPELVAAATSVVASTGGADDFDRLLDAYKNASTPQDELRHLYALAEFDDEALLLRTCELCFGGDVKTQNAPFVLRSCIANRRHGAAAWTLRAPALGRCQRRRSRTTRSSAWSTR